MASGVRSRRPNPVPPEVRTRSTDESSHHFFTAACTGFKDKEPSRSGIEETYRSTQTKPSRSGLGELSAHGNKAIEIGFRRELPIHGIKGVEIRDKEEVPDKWKQRHRDEECRRAGVRDQTATCRS